MNNQTTKNKLNFKAILFISAACMAAISWPTFYFHFHPLPKFDQALTVYSGQYPLLLGGRDGFSDGKSYHRRNYILIPSFFHSPKIIRVIQEDHGQPRVTETKANFEVGLVISLIMLSAIRFARKKQNDN